MELKYVSFGNTTEAMQAFNRTAYGIEIQQTYVIAVVVVILLIAPLMELKSTSACELALSSFLLIAPLMELK